MKKIKRELLSLLAATSILLSATGCGSSIEKEKISLNGLNTLYLVELNNIKNETKLYLTKAWDITICHRALYTEYCIFGSDIVLVNDLNGYDCEYGKVENIIPFSQIITSYTEIKENYTAEEIVDIFECVRNDYDEIKNSDNVKKLELK